MATVSQTAEPVSILKTTTPAAHPQAHAHVHAQGASTHRGVTLSIDKPVHVGPSDDEDDDIVPDMANKCLSEGEDEEPFPQPVSAEAMELLQNEKVITAGYLLKKGEKRRTWKRRWFVLRTTKIAMYKDNKEYKLLRIIDLHEIHSVAHDTSKNKYKCVFAISTPKRAYFFQAKNTAEMCSWMDAIKQARDDLLLNETDDNSSVKGRDLTLAQDVISSYKSNHMTTQQKRRSSGGHSSQQPSASRVRQPSGSSFPEQRHSGASAHAHVRPLDIPKAQIAHPEWANQSTSLHTTDTSFDQGFNSSTTGNDYPCSPISEQLAEQHLNDNLASSEDDEEYSCHEDASASLQQNRVLLSGYLLKLRRIQGWRKRWFVLRTDSLAYFNSDKERGPHRVIPLTHVIDSLEIEPMTKNKRFCFKIVIRKRNYVLCASTEQEMESWLNALSVAVQRAKNKEAETVYSNRPSQKFYPVSQPQPKHVHIQKITTGSSLDSFENMSHLSGISGAGGVGGAGGALPGRAK